MRRSEKRKRRERRRKRTNASRAAASENVLRAEAVSDPEARAELARRAA